MQNITYQITNRGLCSELNSLCGFYENVVNKDCQIFIDDSLSQYFKTVSIYDIFDFGDMFVNKPMPNSEIVSADEWRKTARKNYQPSILVRFKYAESFKIKIYNNINQLNLPKVYKCFHIRRGDKVGEKHYKWTEKTGKKESKRYEFIEYLNNSDRSISSIFIMTDDHKVIKEAEKYQADDLYYLTTKDQQGHSTDEDLEGDRAYTETDLVKFFTEIEIAKGSAQFVGTKSSNIFRYIINQCTNNLELISLG